MPLWGATPSNTSKPKYLTEEEKANTYATKAGWVYKQPNGTEEILVAIGGLADALGAAQITSVFFANTAASYTPGNANAFVTVAYSENVNVTGSPTLVVTGSTTNATATYASGNGSNKLQFKFTVPAGAQTLSLGAQSLASGTIKDAGSNTAADLTISASDVKGVRGKADAASTITVAA